jgi:hypothetical protein
MTIAAGNLSNAPLISPLNKFDVMQVRQYLTVTNRHATHITN